MTTALAATRPYTLSVFLVVYGNLAALLLGTTVPTTPWPGLALGGLLTVSVLAWSRLPPSLSLAELGLQPGRLLRSAALGLLVAAVTAIPALVFLRNPPLVGDAIAYAPLGTVSREALLVRALVWMPLDTVIPEEIAFRGVLLASMWRVFDTRRGVLLSALVFTAWHSVVVTRTVAQTNLESQPLLAALGLIGAFAAIFVGGLVFAWLRLRTGHLAGSMIAHLGFNAVLLLGLPS